MNTVVLLFGGQSEEYDISLRSAAHVLTHIGHSTYKVLPIGITKTGEWLAYFGTPAHILDDTWHECADQLTPVTPVREGFWLEGDSAPLYPIATMPLLHGAFGEDGRLQGLLDTLAISYIGCGCEASAVAMNKHLTKLCVSALHIPTAKWLCVTPTQMTDTTQLIQTVAKVIGFPAFVKPACGGSSIGASPAKSPKELIEALYVAFAHHPLVLVEEYVSGMECEVAIFQDKECLVSPPGAVHIQTPFYDYHTKYASPEVTLSVPAPLPAPVAATMQDYAKRAFLALGCRHICRVDFFYSEASQTIWLNEINTMPGMTPRSLYPQLLSHMGLSTKAMFDRLVAEVAQ